MYPLPWDVVEIELHEEIDILTSTLTRTQEECTKLLLENRELKEKLDEVKGRLRMYMSGNFCS